MKQLMFFCVISVFLISLVTCDSKNFFLPIQSTNEICRSQESITSVQGRPGKIGPVGAQGPVGPRGLPGQCACKPSEIEKLTTEIQKLKEIILMMKNNDKTSHDSLFCGVGIKDSRIPNSAMTASSHWPGEGYRAYYGRLDNTGEPNGFWHPHGGQYHGAWLQVDLGKPTHIIGVITQGRPNRDQWIESYKILYGNTTGGLRSTQSNKIDLIYSGNRDRNSKVTNFFHQQITARYFRLVAVTFHEAPCLRVEYLVC